MPKFKQCFKTLAQSCVGHLVVSYIYHLGHLHDAHPSAKPNFIKANLAQKMPSSASNSSTILRWSPSCVIHLSPGALTRCTPQCEAKFYKSKSCAKNTQVVIIFGRVAAVCIQKKFCAYANSKTDKTTSISVFIACCNQFFPLSNPSRYIFTNSSY